MYHLVAYKNGEVTSENHCRDFLSVVCEVGCLVGVEDVDEIRVFDGVKCVLVYLAGGIFIGPKLAADYTEEELETAMRGL